MISDKDKLALKYHAEPIPGKICIKSTKPCTTSVDLSLAYSPGVAAPCLEIAKNWKDVYKYTAKGNLVAVISNGTAVLGLGNIGPEASKPVMEGKGVLFKKFANIDVFDIELDCQDTDEFIRTVEALAPTFGGINLEDIKAPECFDIETELAKKLNIPVFHDDQHGTAIIATAALINALEVNGKKLEDLKIVFNGAGAAAISCAKLLFKIGLPKENLIMCDSHSVIYKGRTERMNKYKEPFANDTEARTLEEAIEGADVFFGLSVADVLTPKMLLSMNSSPIVFALANPKPEIDYNLALDTREDVIMATGRSDFPNQVNNVLGFPYIFRGALDVHAKAITEEMKIAAVYALASLAKEPVPKSVCKAYGNVKFEFGKDYLIPKPLDPRVLYWVSPQVAKAAIECGVAREELDVTEYKKRLKASNQHSRENVLGSYYSFAKKAQNKEIVFSEGENHKIIQAAAWAAREGIAKPILIGDQTKIEQSAKDVSENISNLEIVDPKHYSKISDLVSTYDEIRAKKPKLAEKTAEDIIACDHLFSNLMLASGNCSGVLAGINRNYSDLARSVLNIIGLEPGYETAAGIFTLISNNRLMFFSDVSINLKMNSKKLADIALMASELARSMDIEPSVAMLSYSNFGSVDYKTAKMVSQAVELVKKADPTLEIDGEMQADTALLHGGTGDKHDLCSLSSPANVFIFPNMAAANITYKFLHQLSGALVVGPIIKGLKKPSYVLQRYAKVEEIFNMTTVAVAQANI